MVGVRAHSDWSRKACQTDSPQWDPCDGFPNGSSVMPPSRHLWAPVLEAHLCAQLVLDPHKTGPRSPTCCAHAYSAAVREGVVLAAHCPPSCPPLPTQKRGTQALQAQIHTHLPVVCLWRALIHLPRPLPRRLTCPCLCDWRRHLPLLSLEVWRVRRLVPLPQQGMASPA